VQAFQRARRADRALATSLNYVVAVRVPVGSRRPRARRSLKFCDMQDRLIA